MPIKPLWAHPKEDDRNLLSWRWAILIALVIVVGVTYALVNFGLTRPMKPTEKKVLKVVMINLPPEPKKEEIKEEKPKPPEPPPKPKVPPKEIKRVVKAPPKIKAKEPEPETAPIPMEAPTPGPAENNAVTIPSAVGPSAPAKNSGATGESVRRDVASLVSCNPDYPPKAMQNGITGEFVVHMTVDPSGMVSDVKIVSGSPRQVFERDIKRSMMKCKFAPTDNGFIAEAPVVFKLEN